ncbi:MAG: hypothetical protein QUS07_07360 [Methanothrix sp.]|nr:hypothetical protein [Methanothrix sp.]
MTMSYKRTALGVNESTCMAGYDISLLEGVHNLEAVLREILFLSFDDSSNTTIALVGV